MGVHDTVNVTTTSQYEGMHRSLNSRPSFTLDNAAILIYHHNILGCKQLVVRTARRQADVSAFKITSAQVALCCLYQMTVIHFLGVKSQFSTQFRQQHLLLLCYSF